MKRSEYNWRFMFFVMLGYWVILIIILFCLAISDLQADSHVQKIVLRYDGSSVARSSAIEAVQIATRLHREQTGHKLRITRVRPFIDHRPDLALWELRERRLDYLYFRFARPVNYTTYFIMASPILVNGKQGSAGVSYVCDRHGGVSILFGGPQHSIEQRALVVAHELGHGLGGYHTPDWYEDVMHVDAQRVYYNAYHGFYPITYKFSDYNKVYYKQCNRDSASVKWTGNVPLWEIYYGN